MSKGGNDSTEGNTVGTGELDARDAGGTKKPISSDRKRAFGGTKRVIINDVGQPGPQHTIDYQIVN